MDHSRGTVAGGSLAALALLTSCAAGSGASPAQDQRADGSIAATLEHVHGLGVDPADGALYAASHFGVFRIDGGRATQIAGRWQDTMAFTVAGPNNFLASGHPDLREDLPAHLGLIESTDAAQTWKWLSLSGKADFHALEVADGNLFGFDAISGQLMVTSDRQHWDILARAAVSDLAWSGEDQNAVWAATTDGLLEIDIEGKVRNEDNEPPLVLIDSPSRGRLVGLTTAGEAYAKDAAPNARWRKVGSATPGTPEAFETSQASWFVATDRGIYESDDQGSTWTERLAVKGAEG